MDKKLPSMNVIVKEVFDFLKTAKEQEWDDQTFADNFAGLDYTIDEKLMAYRKVMDHLEHEANVAKAEKKALTDQSKSYSERATSLENERKRMLYPLLNLFHLLGVNNKRGAYGTFFIRKGSQKLIIDESKVTDRFLKREFKFEVDKDAIKQALAAGEDLDFAYYETAPDTVALTKKQPMKPSQLKIEPHLIEAFISYLKRSGFVAVVSKSKNQPYWINHEQTPHESHVLEVDKFGNFIVPEGLHQTSLEFLCIRHTSK